MDTRVSSKTGAADQGSFFGRLFTGRRKQSLPGSSLRIAPGVRVSESQQGLTLLHIRSGRVFSCNGTGLRIWRDLTSGMSVEAIAAGLSGSYSLPPGRAHADTAAFLSALEEQGLVMRAQ